MAFVHSKNTVIKLGASDISTFTNTSELSRTADSHDVTTYGKSSHVYQGGLLDGKATIGGIYDNAATGPRDIIEPMIGTEVVLTRQPEGTGSGLPQDVVDVIVIGYVETSPVADMVTWSAELQCSDEIVSTNQV
jgi:hypothetical protein